METKQSAMELLQDTLADLVWIAGAYSDSKSMIDNSSAAYEMACTARARREIIESYLAAPSESAMEMVEKIRQTHTVCSLDQFRGKPISYLSFDIHDSDAAALIEGLQRRVPRKMLEEIWVEASRFDANGEYKSIDEIAAKHGVVIE